MITKVMIFYSKLAKILKEKKSLKIPVKIDLNLLKIRNQK